MPIEDRDNTVTFVVHYEDAVHLLSGIRAAELYYKRMANELESGHPIEGAADTIEFFRAKAIIMSRLFDQFEREYNNV